MPIYTRTGDKGQTSVFGGKKLSKSDLLIEALGTIDELNAYLGLCIITIKNTEDKKLLTNIQYDLYQIMACLSGAKGKTDDLGETVKQFERKIDKIQSELPEINGFILPNGTEMSVLFHIARTVCRRAERNTVKYFETLKIVNYELKILKYFNRLSDLLFTFARHYNES